MATSQVTPSLYDDVMSLGPFGQGAPEPVFALKDVEITHVRTIGENHLKLTVEDAGGRVDVLAWRSVGTPLGDVAMQRGRVTLAGKLKDNDWNGRRSAQIELIDIATAI